MVVFLIQQLFLQKILITIVIQLSGAKSFITFSICDPEPFIMYWLYYWLRIQTQGFPDGAVVENPPANAGDMGSIPDPGRSHMPWSN